MINRRAPRPSRAVENLQQFCLNNSAGIDCTVPHTNVKNIYDSTNLIPNPDGSLSLRKPLLIKRDWSRMLKKALNNDLKILNVFPLYTGDAYLVFFQHQDFKYIAIYDDNSFVQGCSLVWTDVNTVLRTRELFITSGSIYGTVISAVGPYSLAELDNAKCFHSNTSTILGNCTVNLASESLKISNTKYPMADVSLYPTHTAGNPLWMPRFIKIYRNYLHKWFFEIHNPEVNVLEMNSSTGDYEHPMNTTLDDMYNLQDSYNNRVPSVKQIVPYTYTELFGNDVVLKTFNAGSTESEVPLAYNTSFSLYEEDLKITNDVMYNSVSGTKSSEHFYTVARVVVTAEDIENAFGRLFKYTIQASISVKVTDGTKVDSLKLSIPAFPVYLTHIKQTPYGTVSEHFEITVPKAENTDKYDLTTECTVYSDYMGHGVSFFEARFDVFNANMSCQLNWTETITIPNTPDVALVTNTVSPTKFRGVNYFPTNIPSTASIYLKAFCDFPSPNISSKYYGTWLYTVDGITWNNLLTKRPETGDAPDNSYDNVIELTVDEKPLKSIEKAASTETHTYAPFFNEKTVDDVSTIVTNRIDLLKIPTEFLTTHFTNASFRFKIVSVQGNGTTNPYSVLGTYGQVDYVPVISNTGEYWYSDLGNSVLGKKLYHKSRIFSFGDSSLKNNIFVSEPGEFVIPFKNTIDISSSEDSIVTSVVPWKDYLFVSTPQALYLVSQVNSGWVTKTANSALGVSQADAECAVSTLNSVIFKSGAKVYMFYPNIYAGDDSVINVTDISSPIEHILEGFDSVSGAFAFGTNSEYVLMLPNLQGTLCLSYDYNTRVWTKTEYSVQFTKHTVNSLTDIVLFGQNPDGNFCEYHYNKTFAEAYGTDVGVPYGDILQESKNGIATDVSNWGNAAYDPWDEDPDTENPAVKVTPIVFGLDTGQKAEAIVTTKQFVETKFVLATLDKADAFPMQLTVHIDGDPHLITRDISTDAAFWKDSFTKGVLNTTFSGLSDNSDTFNVLRQLVVRYSGKGKSIRHILEGQSLSNFKLYETYIRYKLLNVKQ